MSSILSKGVVQKGQVIVTQPIDSPDGTRVVVVSHTNPMVPDLEEEWAGHDFGSAKIGLDESEWRDDPEALADWAGWLQTIEPVPFAV